MATLLDLRQAEQLVDTAAETIPVIQQEIEQTENQIHLLLGEPPGTIPRGPEPHRPGNPARSSSRAHHRRCCERRPDIRAAEQDLIAANAEIGVARAQYFPQLTLSGFLGGQSTQLANLISGPTSAWNLAPQLAQPIFTAGRLKSGVRLAEAQREHFLVQYEKTIQTAFTEVSNSLIAHQRVRESRVRQERAGLRAGRPAAARLFALPGRRGYATRRFGRRSRFVLGPIALSQIHLSEVLAVVQLYKALGGGWQ